MHLLDVLNWSTKACYAKVRHKLKQLGGDVKYDEDHQHYVFCDFGYQTPIMLVAHMDTVDDDIEGFKKFGLTKNIKLKDGVIENFSGGVLGADDRAGVAGILTLLDWCKQTRRPMPAVLFTTGEESGGIGVAEFCKTDLFDASKINLMIELDRQGWSEYVTYHDLPQAAHDYVQSFGWTYGHGIYSDIMDLTQEYKIPSVNVSIGYYKQHSKHEFLVVDDYQDSLDKVKAMLDNPFTQHLKVESAIPWWGAYSVDFTPELPGCEDFHDVLSQHCPEGVCTYCGQMWYNCDCGDVVTWITNDCEEEDIDYIYDFYLEPQDKLYRDLLPLKEWYHAV